MNQYLMAIPVLAFVLGLVLVAGRVAGRFGIGRTATTGRQVRLVERVALDRGRQLHIVECRDRGMLLLVGGSADIVLDRWEIDTPAKGDGA